MSREEDLAQERTLYDTEAAVRAAAKDLEPGNPGDCDLCGEWFSRLIKGACGRCRDKYKI